MQTATPDISSLLAGLLPGQGPASGAVIGAGRPAQGVEPKSENGPSPFLSALRASQQQLPLDSPSGAAGLNPEALRAVVEQLIGGQAATAGSPLPQPPGQGLAAEELEALLAQLELPPDSLAAVFKQIKLATAQRDADTDADAAADPIADAPFPPLLNMTPAPSPAADARLLDERVAALANAHMPIQAPLATGRQPQPPTAAPALELDSVEVSANPEAGQRLSVNPVPAIPPAMLERVMMNTNLERRPSAELLNWSDGQIDSLATLQGGSQGRPMTTTTAGDARPTQSFIQTPLNDPQWQQDFSNRVVMLARGGATGQAQVAEIRLNPAHLGPVEVRVVMNDDQASITFSAHHTAVRDAIETSLPRLREMFSGSGVQLADATVSDQSLQDRRQRHQQGQADGHGFAAAPSGFDDDAERVIGQVDLSALPLQRGLDLYA